MENIPAPAPKIIVLTIGYLGEVCLKGRHGGRLEKSQNGKKTMPRLSEKKGN